MHVEKQRIAVRISMSGHDPLGGFLSLGPQSAGHMAYESVLELLNSSQRVIPFIQEDGQVILLTRANLAWVMAVERERSLVVPADYVVVREEPVELSFVNGSTIDGQIQIEETATGSRASDCLNAPADFYPVKTRLGILLVNKARVCETRLGRGTPRVEDAEPEAAREVVVEIDDADTDAVPPVARGAQPRPGIAPRKA